MEAKETTKDDNETTDHVSKFIQDPSQNPPGMIHGSWLCPGLHGADASPATTSVHTFHTLIITKQSETDVYDPLSSSATCSIAIPPFQRRYCWAQNQHSQLWKNLTQKESGSSPQGHHFGKIIACFIPGYSSETRWLCLDGQQRIATFSFMIASIRDSVDSIIDSLPLDGHSEAINSALHLREELESFLFSDIDAKNLWIENKGWTEIQDGDVLDFFRLVPSFLDRLPYYMILAGTKARADSLLPSSDYQYRCKHFFDETIHKDLQSQKEPLLQIRRLELLYYRLTQRLSFVVHRIHEDKYAQQIFQWIQEKELLNGVLLINACPGIRLQAIDLVKNLLLSHLYFARSTADNLLLEQEKKLVTLYRRHWLPFEESLLSMLPPNALDIHLKWFMDKMGVLGISTKNPDPAKANFDAMILQRFPKMKDAMGTMNLYKDFVEFFAESDIGENGKNEEDSNETAKSQRLLQRALWVLKKFEETLPDLKNDLETKEMGERQQGKETIGNK